MIGNLVKSNVGVPKGRAINVEKVNGTWKISLKVSSREISMNDLLFVIDKIRVRIKEIEPSKSFYYLVLLNKDEIICLPETSCTQFSEEDTNAGKNY